MLCGCYYEQILQSVSKDHKGMFCLDNCIGVILTSELLANFLVRCESGVTASLARFWPILVRVRVRGRVRVRVRVSVTVTGWVYARTLIPP